MIGDVAAYRKMGYRGNASCGLHVHIDALDLSNADRTALFRFGRWIQDDMYKLVSPGRAASMYCLKLGRNFPRARYHWLNLLAYQKHRTVEVRLHHGTTNPERIGEWVKLCLRVVEMGLKLGRLSRKPEMTMFQLLDLTPYEVAYWTEVGKSIHGPNVWKTPAPGTVVEEAPESVEG
jgi:hypothetical protein